MKNTGLDAAILRSEEEILAVIAEWRALYQMHGKIFFTNPDYILLWWQTIGAAAGWEWHIVILREHGRLVAVAPLAVHVRRSVGIARWAGADVFDYCDVLLEAEQYQAALWHAVENSPHYTIALLTDVHPQSSCRAFLDKHSRCYGKAEASCLNLSWKDGDAWLKSLPSAYRKNYNRQSRRLEENGPVCYQVTQRTPLPPGVIDFLVEQKIAWCRQNHIESIFDAPRIKEYFTGLAERAAQSGKLALSSLYCGETLIAVQLDFIENGTFYTYMPSYHMEWSAYSPGRIMEYRSIMWAIDNGCSRFDLMRGSEEYKKRLTDDYQTLHHYLMARGIFGKTCSALYLALRWVKSKRAKGH